ncbi:hypothetical protein DL769_004133 [Monosporascus sp. CRB-8-3]|nr:hypothetical protein DL769_004133 [Monosporascus sp. CRB-8-3]
MATFVSSAKQPEHAALQKALMTYVTSVQTQEYMSSGHRFLRLLRCRHNTGGTCSPTQIRETVVSTNEGHGLPEEQVVASAIDQRPRIGGSPCPDGEDSAETNCHPTAPLPPEAFHVAPIADEQNAGNGDQDDATPRVRRPSFPRLRTACKAGVRPRKTYRVHWRRRGWRRSVDFLDAAAAAAIPRNGAAAISPEP